MKAITIWQPWASLAAIKKKRYETRSWATRYRGPIAIHAAKRPFDPMDFAIFDPHFAEAMTEAFKEAEMSVHLLPFGCIIATAELVDCHRIRVDPKSYQVALYDSCGNQTSVSISSKEILFGDWTPGRFAWDFKNVVMLPEPVPAKGGQRLWNWDERQIGD